MESREEILDKYLIGKCCDRETDYIDDYCIYDDIQEAMQEYSDQQNKHQIECTEHIKEVCDDYEKQNKALLDEIERLRSVLTETINEKFEIDDKYISKCGDCVQAWQFSNLMIDENKKLKDEIERLKSELKDKDSVISDLKQAMIRGKDFNNLTFD